MFVLLGQAEARHAMNHGDVDPRLAARGVVFVVLGQPPMTAKPPDRPLDKPPPLLHLKGRLPGTLAHHLQDPPSMGGDPTHQSLHPGRRVGPDLRQPRQGLADPLEHLHGPIPVDWGGRRDDQSPHQPQGIDQQVALAAGHLLPPVVLLRAAGLGRLHRVAIEDPATEGRLPPGGCPDLGPQGGVDALLGAVVPPDVEVVGHRLPGREVVGEHPPGTPAARQVQGGIDDFPQGIGKGPAQLPLGPGQQVLDIVPLQVGQVARVSLSGAHPFRVEATREQGSALSRWPVRTIVVLSLLSVYSDNYVRPHRQ
jgi:hypothetical protein